MGQVRPLSGIPKMDRSAQKKGADTVLDAVAAVQDDRPFDRVVA